MVGTLNNDATNGICQAVFVADNITGGTRVITGNLVASEQFRRILVLEFSGRATVALDKGPGNNAGTSGTAVTSAAVTTTTDGQ